MHNIITIVVAILAGLAGCIPLVAKLVEYIRAAVQEKNWGNLLGLIIELMEEAESKFNDGATRKEWVMAMVQSSAEYINYTIDTESISTLIDTLCNMTKVVNAPTDEAKEVEA